MLFRAPVVVLAAFFAGSALATYCPAGTYRLPGSGGSYTCPTCPAGQINPTQTTSTSCQTCPAGTENNAAHTACVACPAGEVNPTQGSTCQPCSAGKGPNSSKTQCINCTGETYSTGGTACMTCPAGTDANPNHTGCDKCAKGYYNPTAGNACQKCPAGKFNNVLGSKSCCDCCAGFYSSSTGSTSCTQCSTSNKYSDVGSNSSSDCKSTKGSRPNPVTTGCTMVADNVCPNPTGGSPQGTAITRKRDAKCTNGFTSCPRYSGRGGVDCVDTENDPESCGGCVGLDGQGSGTDCTAIQGTSATSCVKGSCVIDSCRKGWLKSLDGSSCVLASRATGSPQSDGIHAQDKKAKRSSAKRAIRHTIF